MLHTNNTTTLPRPITPLPHPQPHSAHHSSNLSHPPLSPPPPLSQCARQNLEYVRNKRESIRRHDLDKLQRREKERLRQQQQLQQEQREQQKKQQQRPPRQVRSEHILEVINPPLTPSDFPSPTLPSPPLWLSSGPIRACLGGRRRERARVLDAEGGAGAGSSPAGDAGVGSRDGVQRR